MGAAGVRRFGQLRELERDGFLLRRDFCQVPPHAEYTLTELGESFLPVMEEMTAWEETRLGTGRGAGGGKLAEKCGNVKSKCEKNIKFFERVKSGRRRTP